MKGFGIKKILTISAFLMITVTAAAANKKTTPNHDLSPHKTTSAGCMACHQNEPNRSHFESHKKSG